MFSAASEQALNRSISDFAEYIGKNGEAQMRDLAYTLHARRSVFPFRKSFSGANVEAIHSKMLQFLSAGEQLGRMDYIPKSARTLGVFTGQGAQWATMGREFLIHFPSIREKVKKLEESLSKLPQEDRPTWSLEQEMMASPVISRIHEAEISQPLCTVLQIILVDLLAAAGIKFDVVVGHSSGEIGAAYAAGYLTAEDAVYIAYYRGLYSKSARSSSGTRGAMMAVGTSLEDATELCEMDDLKGRISVAACNSSSSVTLSGDEDAIDEAMIVLEDEGKFVRKLKVDTAYHSHHMLPVSDRYIQSLKACNIQPLPSGGSSCRWYSSVTTDMVNPLGQALKDTYWSDNMTNPVFFAQALQAAFQKEESLGIAIEVGPHPALRNPTIQTIQEISKTSIRYQATFERGKSDIEAFANTLGFIWSKFVEQRADFASFDQALSGSTPSNFLTDLPSYSWEHDRVYWLESRLSRLIRQRDTPVHELLGTVQPDSTKVLLRWRNMLSEKEVPWLSGHKLQGQTVFPAAGYISMAVEAAMQLAGDREVESIEMSDLMIERAMLFHPNQPVETWFSLTIDDDGAHDSHIHTEVRLDGATSTTVNELSLFFKGRMAIKLGQGSDALLPPRAPPLVDTVDVDKENFYSSLSDLGYEYTDLFRALSGMKRTMDAGTGLIANPQALQPDRPLLVHPAMLDAAIQAVILAYCWPGDSRLWSIHVPTGIKRIKFNPTLLKSFAGQEVSLPVDSCIGNNQNLAISGDVDIYSPDGLSAVIQLEELEAVPFSAPDSDSDAKLFFDIQWGTAFPDGALMANGVRASEQDYELSVLHERLSYYYLRTLTEDISEEELAASEWHFKQLMKFAWHYISKIEDGSQPYTDKNWKNDTKEEIFKELDRYVPWAISFYALLTRPKMAFRYYH